MCLPGVGCSLSYTSWLYRVGCQSNHKYVVRDLWGQIVILKRVGIKNFRSIRQGEVELGPHIAILGGNGTGKSTVLHAIERFYSPSGNIELDDFFGRRTDNSIEIELTFIGLDAAEMELFGSHVHDGEMSVVRVFEANAGRNNGRYYGMSRQHLPFAGIRALSGAAEKRAAYHALRSGSYADLPSVTRAEAIEGHLLTWEQAHPERCGLGRDSGQFFGFSNVGRGSLQRFTSFVFIPAVREAGGDAVDAKGAVIARLMELVVRSAIQQRADIRMFQTEVSERFRQLTDPSSLTELGDLSSTLTATLRRLYLEAAVHLRWREPEDFLIPLPSADVLIDDDGFEGPVDRKGHGLQRAFILTLLQHLAHASAESAREAQETEAAVVQPAAEMIQEVEESSEDRRPLPPERPAFVLPGLILAIEEPELYQHPTKQRHFANVLRRLSEGSLPGVAAQTQVIFASHSSLFVAADRFDEIRLARRRPVPGLSHKECVLTSSSLTSICRRLESAFAEREGTRTIEGLRSRLHVLGPELSEGFFADLVVLVEGPSDKAAIAAAAALVNFDLAANGVAILPVTGKTGLVNPACIFQELQIPIFVVWDCDKGSDDPKVSYNHALQRISGVAAANLTDYTSAVGDHFATFEVDLETTVNAELADEAFSRLLDAARDKFGLQFRSDVSKSPAAMTDVLQSAYSEGKASVTLVRIVAAVAALRRAQQPAANAEGAETTNP
jgi:putative ATP-dependent endonuclease of OLD family